MARSGDDFQVRGWFYTQLPIWMTCDKNLSSGAKVLAAYLLYRQRMNDACWPSLATISDDLGCSQDTARRWCRELVKAGYMKVERRTGRSNLYRLHDLPKKAPALSHRISQELSTAFNSTPGIFARGSPGKDARGVLADLPPPPSKNATQKYNNEVYQLKDIVDGWLPLEDAGMLAQWESLQRDIWPRQYTGATYQSFLARLQPMVRADEGEKGVLGLWLDHPQVAETFESRMLPVIADEIKWYMKGVEEVRIVRKER